jgi:hypothetical protein
MNKEDFINWALETPRLNPLDEETRHKWAVNAVNYVNINRYGDSFLENLQLMEDGARIVRSAFTWKEAPEGMNFWISAHESVVEEMRK